MRAFIRFPAVLYDDTFPHADERANSHTRATGGSGRLGGQPGLEQMSDPTLTRSLRERDLVAIVINGVIGAGIFGLPGKLYALVGPYSQIGRASCRERG